MNQVEGDGLGNRDYRDPRHFRHIRPAPIQATVRITPGAGIVVVDAVAGGCVGGMVEGGGGLVTTCVTPVVITVVAGRVTGVFVVTGTV